MRKVFSNARDVFHAWANERQPEARNGSDNVSFHGAIAFSYATPIGRIVRNPEGAVAYLVTSRSYSVTTAKHVGWLWSAIPGYLRDRIFRVPEVDRGGMNYDGWTHERALANYAERIAAAQQKAARARSDNATALHTTIAHELAEQADRYCNFFGLAPMYAPEVIERLRADVRANEARANEVREREAREHDAEQRIKLVERVPLWLEGQLSQTAVANYPETLLRLVQTGTRAEEVETSRGVTVWASDARRAFAVYMADPSRLIGQQLDVYAIRVADARGLQIGCHWLTRAEILRFGLACGWMSAETLSMDDARMQIVYSAQLAGVVAV